MLSNLKNFFKTHSSNILFNILLFLIIFLLCLLSFGAGILVQHNLQKPALEIETPSENLPE
ncbi:MAG: hypothetical protein QMC93_01075 [Patescibacteria group bacterium]|nr:hypothetical protein [Patescibacteria group bacterium]